MTASAVDIACTIRIDVEQLIQMEPGQIKAVMEGLENLVIAAKVASVMGTSVHDGSDRVRQLLADNNKHDSDRLRKALENIDR